ncbi:hypothetical protein [Kitasatospora purpeofusca]|uniref:hypothetical protein n=1 Tax=Kitasatospora purpeofusca TaxID=67352 RepID=UPI0037F11683
MGSRCVTSTLPGARRRGHCLTGFTTSKKQADGSWANATSKLNHYGGDSDEVRWTTEDTTQGTLTRNVAGPDADLVATTSRTGDVQLQLTNLFGSVTITTDTALTKPVVLDFDEFGIPQGWQRERLRLLHRRSGQLHRPRRQLGHAQVAERRRLRSSSRSSAEQ